MNLGWEKPLTPQQVIPEQIKSSSTMRLLRLQYHTKWQETPGKNEKPY